MWSLISTKHFGYGKTRVNLLDKFHKNRIFPRDIIILTQLTEVADIEEIREVPGSQQKGL